MIDATVLQPQPRYAPAFSIKEVTADRIPASTAGIGWGADVGISDRARLKGEHLHLNSPPHALDLQML